jgi:hypothetical protein
MPVKHEAFPPMALERSDSFTSLPLYPLGNSLLTPLDPGAAEKKYLALCGKSNPDSAAAHSIACSLY